MRSTWRSKPALGLQLTVSGRGQQHRIRRRVPEKETELRGDRVAVEPETVLVIRIRLDHLLDEQKRRRGQHARPGSTPGPDRNRW